MVSPWQGNGKTQILIQGGENETGRIEVCGPVEALPCRRNLFSVWMCRWLLVAWFGFKYSSKGYPNSMPGKERNQEWAVWDELILHKSKNQGFTVIIFSRRKTATANYLFEKNIV